MHRFVSAVALAGAILTWDRGALGKGDKRGAHVTTPFDPRKAAAQLGHAGEAFEEISPYHLPEIYWLRIGSGANVLGGAFIVHKGELVAEKGYATASAWLRRAVIPLKTAPEAAYVAQVLDRYEALPIGWHGTDSGVVDAATGERGGLKLHPFELKLVSLGYVHTMSRILKAPMSGPPEPGNPPGGYAPQEPCRAVLKELDGKLTWIAEQRESDGSWRLLLKEPIE
jgi:hypothetical protein